MKNIQSSSSEQNADKERKSIFLVVLAIILLFHLANNYIWLRLDNTSLMHDSHWHHLFSLRVFEEIKNNFPPMLSNIYEDFIYYRWHGIFVGYITSPFYFLFGTSQDAGVMINSAVFLAILVFSTYGIGKRLFNEKAGLLSAFIVTMYPLVFNQLRVYMLDLPLTSMVTASILLLMATDNFTNKKYSLLFAVSVGLGMLTKFNFAGFIIGPLLIVLYRTFNNKNTGSNQKKTLLAVFLISAAISFTFYKFKFWEVFSRIYECSWVYAVKYYPESSLFSLTQRWISIAADFMFWCLKEMINNSLSFFFFFLFIVSLAIFIRKKIYNKKILYLWIFLPLISLIFIFHKPSINRYFMPFLPAFAIISGIAITDIKNIKFRKAIMVLTIFLGCFQYMSISYNSHFLPHRIQAPFLNNIYLFNRNISIDHRNNNHTFSYPSRVDWNNEKILNRIIEESGGFRHKISVFFIGNIPQVYEPIAYISFIKRYPLIINVVSLAEEKGYKDAASTMYMITTSDYVVKRKEEKRDRELSGFVEERTKEASQLFEQNVASFKIIGEFKIQDGTTLLVYKKKADYIRIAKGPIEFYFRSGITRLYYNGIEITKDLGLETSFDANGSHFVSVGAIWDASITENGKIIAVARWPGSIFLQKWELDVSEDNCISWKVWTNIKKETIIKNRRFSLILSGIYKEYVSSQGKNRFSNENIFNFKTVSLPVSIQNYVGVCEFKKAQLPKVVFNPIQGLFKIVPTVSWRKDLRVLGFITEEKDGVYLLPGGHNLFSGKILIEKD